MQNFVAFLIARSQGSLIHADVHSPMLMHGESVRQQARDIKTSSACQGDGCITDSVPYGQDRSADQPNFSIGTATDANTGSPMTAAQKGYNYALGNTNASSSQAKMSRMAPISTPNVSSRDDDQQPDGRAATSYKGKEKAWVIPIVGTNLLTSKKLGSDDSPSATEHYVGQDAFIHPAEMRSASYTGSIPTPNTEKMPLDQTAEDA